MPDEFITPNTPTPELSVSRQKTKRPRRRVAAKRKPVKKSSGHSFRTFLLSVIGAGVVMLVVGYTIGISLGVNLGTKFEIREFQPQAGQSLAEEIKNAPATVEVAEIPVEKVEDQIPSDEQVACLKKALGAERYVEIASNVGQPTLDEQAQMAVCIK